MQARHERCFQELKDLEKQLALLEEHNKMNKLRRDFKAAQYRPAEKHASRVSTRGDLFYCCSNLYLHLYILASSALTLLVGHQEEHPACKN